MSFDYFNVGQLAYGKKITAAFGTLEALSKDMDAGLENLINVLHYYNQYVGNNYKAPEPIRPDMPVRTNELFELVGRGYQFSKFRYSSGRVRIEFYYTHPTTHVMTFAKGSTTIKKGYAFFTPAIWNADNSRTIRFSDKNDIKAKETLICKYMVSEDNDLRILKFGDPVKDVYPYDWSQVTDILPGEDIGTFKDGKYTAKDFECILVKQVRPVKYFTEDKDKDYVYLNGQIVMWDNSQQTCNYQVLYLKPGDVIRGTFEGFKLIYFNDRL